MNVNENLQKQWLQDLAESGISPPKLLDIAIQSQGITDNATDACARLSERLLNALADDPL
ncbi:MAG: hypothetical protein ACJ8FY_29155 [Gemmataceae bacterium]